MGKRFGKIGKKIKNRLDQRGQVGILMLFIIAVALIIFAISTNVARISDTKTKITLAADSGAAYMASSVASYGQSLFKEQLGGKRKKCSSGFLMQIIAFVLIIVIAVITIVTGGAGIVLFAAVVAILAAVAGMALQIMVVQPGITNSWNKIMDATMTQTDQFVEKGIQQALQKAVTDFVQVRDFYDDDQDTFYDDPGSSEKVDTIGRFGYYYSRRINGIKAPDREALYSFLNKLRCLVYGTDEFCSENDDIDTMWALTDPMDFQSRFVREEICHFDPIRPDEPIPSVCNRCCVPEFLYNTAGDEDESVRFRPECCDAEGSARCGNEALCPIYSPYGEEYPYVYDSTLENPLNELISFREKFGYDDENARYSRKLATVREPLNLAIQGGQSNIVQNFNYLTGEDDYEAWDATGFPVQDKIGGVFSALMLAERFFIDLDDLDAAVAGTPTKGACYWVDTDQRISSDCDYDVFWNYGHALFGSPEKYYERLKLPLQADYVTFNEINADDIVYGPRIETTTYVNNGRGANASYADIDIVALPDTILAEPDECAQEAIPDDPGPNVKGMWKPGADRYCSTGGTGDRYYPYYENCDKHRPSGNTCKVDDGEGGTIEIDCICSDANVDKTLFNEDILDEVAYGLEDFVRYVDMLFETPDDQLAIQLGQWYDEAARWFEPAAEDGAICFNCDNADINENPIDGKFHRIHKNIRLALNRLIEWRDTSFLDDAAWCMPENKNKLADGEEDTFDFNENGIDGDIEDIIACLNWNASHDPGKSFPDEGILFQESAASFLPSDMTDRAVVGNASKFEYCALTCSDDACLDLPRSLLPEADYDPEDYRSSGSGREGDLQGLLACFYDCNQCAGVNILQPIVDDDDNPILDPLDNPVTGPSCDFPLKEILQDEINSINPICEPSLEQAVGAGGQASWIDKTRQSAFEAAMQVSKFERRAQYLSDILERLNDNIEILDLAEKRFDAFLNGTYRGGDDDDTKDPIAEQILGGALDLIAAREQLAGLDENNEAQLPYHIVYAWQDEPKKGQREEDAAWHFVRVDARVPGRCDNACNPNQDGPQKLPRVRAYTKGFMGSTRCYELDRTDGVVKIRVTRYDGPKFDPEGARNVFRFPNGMPIWQFRGQQQDATTADGRPRVEPGSVNEFLKALAVADPEHNGPCVNYIAKGPEGDLDAYKGAFMIDHPVVYNEDDADGSNGACWLRVNQLLSIGSVAERCAQYYFHGGTTKGFSFQFVECKDF